MTALRSRWITLLPIAVLAAPLAATALTLSTPCGTAIGPGNPTSASVAACAFDGGTFGPAFMGAQANSNDTFLFPNVLVVNPVGNIMGDDPNAPAFVEASHLTLFSDLQHLFLGPGGWNVRLEEPGASFTLVVVATANQQLVNSVTGTFVFDEAAGCIIGQFCHLDGLQSFDVNILNVNEIGGRWTFVADGGQTDTFVPEPGTALLVAGGLVLLGSRGKRSAP